MIQAERSELETHLQRSTVAIRERELATFTENFAVLSTQSVFLTGLGFGGITMTPIWDPEDRVVTQCFFYTACTMAIGFNVLTMCITSWSMIFGPGLGIRGPQGSMSRAVKGMYAERKLAIRFYLAGLVSMCCAAVSLGWLKYGCIICSDNTNDSTNYLTDGFGCKSTAEWDLICYRVPIIITVIFFFFMVFTVTHMAYVTRPRFTFKVDGKSRRPEDAFTVGGAYDAENQEAVQNVLAQQAAGAEETPGMDKKREAVGRQIKQIEALEKDGTLSAAQAAEEKKAVIARFMDEVVEEPMPSTAASKGGSFLSSGFGYVHCPWKEGEKGEGEGEGEGRSRPTNSCSSSRPDSEAYSSSSPKVYHEKASVAVIHEQQIVVHVLQRDCKD